MLCYHVDTLSYRNQIEYCTGYTVHGKDFLHVNNIGAACVIHKN